MLRQSIVLSTALSVCLVCFPGYVATAQSTAVGVTGGINRSTVLAGAEDTESVLARIGFHAGGVLSIQSTGPLGFQFGANYHLKGFELETDDPDVTGGLRLAYFEVPILGVATIPTGSVRPFLFGGPAFGFLLTCDVIATTQAGSASADCATGGITTTSFDAGVMFGGGLSAGTRPAIGVDVGYTLGLLNIDDTPGLASEIKNRDLFASLRILFPIH